MSGQSDPLPVAVFFQVNALTLVSRHDIRRGSLALWLIGSFAISQAAWADNGWLETWAYRTADTPNSFSNMVQLRYYQPFALPTADAGWQGMMRLDTSIVSNSGPAFPGEAGNQFNPGNTRLTLWANTPQSAQQIRGAAGFRVSAPTGDNNPNYSAAQWIAGPQAGMSWAPKDAGLLTDFSPLARYMMGFSATNPQVTALKRSLELYPTIGLRLSERVTVRLWDENAIVLNSATGVWFIPVDAYATYVFTPHWSASLGGAKRLTNTSQYNWVGYGRVTYRF